MAYFTIFNKWSMAYITNYGPIITAMGIVAGETALDRYGIISVGLLDLIS